MNPEDSLNSWRQIRASLAAYDPVALASRLREVLAPLKAGDFSKPALQPRIEEVKQLLWSELGPWYNLSGLSLGNASLGGYCWCHSFFNQAPVPTRDVDENIELMLEALERIQEYLDALDAVFEATRGELAAAAGNAKRRARALADGLVETVEVTARMTGCEDAWYRIAERALWWCVTALDLYVKPAAEKLMNTCFVFGSWVAPSEDALRSAAARVAASVAP
ncbi:MULTISPECIES: hypothetical protein [Corallococcus]|uniref:hypothetical protein n=1 Tax=Corallococcus TaxID=83461 RepID=UPI00117F2ED8|nr:MULTISPECIES: hypothetical protein [Corallococcus]NBD09539.1 hypothetical protein [Corallococcus silvisoli]TSC31487.1 hypothetical protein FOF48_12505 [Corallococcus sp. Z5C101001]